MRRAQVDLRAARAELSRSEELHEEGLISSTELERVQVQVERSELNYQQALLSLLSLQPRISVVEAWKFVQDGGKRFVRLTLTNLTPAVDDSELRMLSDFEGATPIPEELRTRDVRDVYVSIKAVGEGGTTGTATGSRTTIGIPYEQRIPLLAYGEAETLRFQLLRDVDSGEYWSTAHQPTAVPSR